MKEHRPVVFPKDRGADLDEAIGPNSDQEPVERQMMKSAECDAIVHARVAARLAVGNDVSCTEQLPMAKVAQGAFLSVGRQDALAKRTLMQPTPHDCGDVGSARLRVFGNPCRTFDGIFRCPLGEACIVNCDPEGK